MTLAILSPWDSNSKEVFGRRIIKINTRKEGMSVKFREDKNKSFDKVYITKVLVNYLAVSQF